MPLQRPPSLWTVGRTFARFRPLAPFLTTLILCVLAPRLAEAQGVTTSAMNGFITSDVGKPLEDAQVVAVHLPSGTEYRATARTGGAYSAAQHARRRAVPGDGDDDRASSRRPPRTCC